MLRFIFPLLRLLLIVFVAAAALTYGVVVDWRTLRTNFTREEWVEAVRFVRDGR